MTKSIKIPAATAAEADEGFNAFEDRVEKLGARVYVGRMMESKMCSVSIKAPSGAVIETRHYKDAVAAARTIVNIPDDIVRLLVSASEHVAFLISGGRLYDVSDNQDEINQSLTGRKAMTMSELARIANREALF
jgi:hypothetical protein